MDEHGKQDGVDGAGETLVNAEPQAVASDGTHRVVIVPWGEVRSASGDFIVDAESARAAVEAFAAQANELPIDYEHQTLGGRYASPSGQAPAAGWVRRLEAVEGEGLVAEVTWTDRARALIAGREYRYLSPVVIVRKDDRRLVALHSAALTNKPAIHGMSPIVNRASVGGDDLADGEAETHEEDGLMGSALDGLREELGLDASVEGEDVLVAASERLAALRADRRQREAKEKVTAAMKAGKLTSAQKGWATELILRDPETFDLWLSEAPVVVPLGRVVPPSSGEAGDRRRASVIVCAKQAYRDNELLAALTSEEAFVADALREAGIE